MEKISNDNFKSSNKIERKKRKQQNKTFMKTKWDEYLSILTFSKF